MFNFNLLIMEKLKNSDLYEIKQVIEKVKNLGTNQFKLPLILIEMEVDKHLKALDALREPSETFKKYDETRKLKIAEFSEKDGSGNLILYEFPGGQGKRSINGFPKIVGDEKLLEKAVKKIDADYKQVIEEQEKKEKEWQKILPDVSNIELKPIPLDLFPEMDYDSLKVLLKLAKDENLSE